MKMTSIAAIAALGITLSGCSTLVNGTHQEVSISTPPATGATCTLTSTEGTWTLASPGTARVDRTKHDLNVTCTKPGYQDGTAVVHARFQPWTLGNLVLGGAPGFLIDGVTGAMTQYPAQIEVPMQPMTTMPDAPVPGTTTKPAS